MLVNNPTEQKIEFKSVLPKIKTPEEILDEFNKVAVETEKKEIEIKEEPKVEEPVKQPIEETPEQPIEQPKEEEEKKDE